MSRSASSRLLTVIAVAVPGLCLQACGETEQTEITCVSGIEKGGGLFAVHSISANKQSGLSKIVATDATGLCELIAKAAEGDFKVTRVAPTKIRIDGTVGFVLLDGEDFPKHYAIQRVVRPRFPKLDARANSANSPERYIYRPAGA
jgi:hypothetical protein